MSLRHTVIYVVVLLLSVTAYAGGVPDSASEVCPIKVGEPVPAAVLKDVKGKDFNLQAALKQKPTVLIFYRGSWCPYCNVHLGELKTIEDKLASLSYQVIAVSPDLPKNLQTSVDKNELSYQLVSDADGELIKAMGLAFRVDEDLYKKYSGYNINLEEASGQKHHLLPVPAAVVVDTNGVVQFVFFSPDYSVRIKPDVLLSAAKASIE